MPEIDVVNKENVKVESITLDDALFGITPNEHVVHEAVKMQMASERQGTAATKCKAEVAGSGKKPWRQKGTGRARVGTTRSPIWRGGGIVFGPRPRNYSYSIPRKKRKLAIKSLFSASVLNEEMMVLDKIEIEKPATKSVIALLDKLGLNGKVLFIADPENENLALSVRNIQRVKLVASYEVNSYDLITADNILATKEAIEELTARLQ